MSAAETHQAQASLGGCSWSEDFVLSGFDGEILTSVVWDDGSGAALYVGGSFRTIGSAEIASIARWDGSVWSPVVDRWNFAVDGPVRALVVFDDGSGEALFVGGDFVTAGGRVVNHLARWDGHEWRALSGPRGAGIDGELAAMAVVRADDRQTLYVGGTFDTAGGVIANNVAAWSDDGWRNLRWSDGIGIDGSVTEMADLGGSLVVGGRLRDASHSYSVARWDGTWTPIEGITFSDPEVITLAGFDDGSGTALYAAGIGGVMRWDGETWFPVEDPAGTGFEDLVDGTGGPTRVNVMAAMDVGGTPTLVVGGSECFACGVQGRQSAVLASWDGRSWEVLADGAAGSVADGTIAALAADDTDGSGGVYAAGWHLAHRDSFLGDVARWDGDAWHPVGLSSGQGVAPSSRIDDLVRYDDDTGERLYASGVFSVAGDRIATGIASWDGNAWQPLVDGAGNGACSTLQCAPPTAMVVHDDGDGERLWVGATVDSGLGHTAVRVASWDGRSWRLRSTTPLLYDRLEDMMVFDPGSGPSIFGCGLFSTSNETVMEFSGTGWVPLPGFGGYPVGGEARTLETWNDGTGDALYVAGDFVEAAGTVVNRIVRWDGSSWSALHGPEGVGVGSASAQSASIHDMAVFDDGSGPALYVAGEFSDAGGLHVNNIARWDGRRWSPLEGSGGVGTAGPVRALGVYDDGTAEALFVAGSFVHAGGMVVVDGLARWDGHEWSAVCPAGRGPVGEVRSFAVHDDGAGESLFLGGALNEVCGVPSYGVARFTCPRFDLGDAPEPPFATLLASGGPRHRISPGLHLGAGVSHEHDGKRSPNADADDLDDGVAIVGSVIPGFPALVEVTVSSDAVLDGWIDFNSDGDWSDVGERVFDRLQIPGGRNTLSLDVPPTAVVGAVAFARFRLSSSGVSGPTGDAEDGEVEDYEVEILPNPTRSGSRRLAP